MVFINLNVKHLATALSMASNVLKETAIPIFFDKTQIRIKKCEFNETRQATFIFQIRFHDLLHYYCHKPMGFLIDSLEGAQMAKRHRN